MPRITFYISDEDKKDWYEKFKEYIGESASSFHVESVKKYVLAKERELKGMKDVVIPVGETHDDLNIVNIKHVKFIGKQISQCTVREFDESGDSKYTLYLTRKGNLLVQEQYGRLDGLTEHNYKVYEKHDDFFKAGYPSQIINDALKILPEIQCEELDV